MYMHTYVDTCLQVIKHFIKKAYNQMKDRSLLESKDFLFTSNVLGYLLGLYYMGTKWYGSYFLVKCRKIFSKDMFLQSFLGHLKVRWQSTANCMSPFIIMKSQLQTNGQHFKS